MKLTKTQLREIIKEEIHSLNEDRHSTMNYQIDSVIVPTLLKLGFNQVKGAHQGGRPFQKEHKGGVIRIWVEQVIGDATKVILYIDYFPFKESIFNKIFGRQVKDWDKQRNLYNSDIEGYIDLGTSKLPIDGDDLAKLITTKVKSAISKV
jgi:hypothetical protein